MAAARTKKTTISRRKPPAKPENQDLVAAKGTHGGSRGGGRPRTADKYAGAVRLAEKKIGDKLPVLIERMMDLAMGVTVRETPDETLRRVTQESRQNGVADPLPRVYERPPDFKALQYLIDRIMGKPVQAEVLPGGNAPQGVGSRPVQIFLPDNSRTVIGNIPAHPSLPPDPGQGGVMTIDVEVDAEEDEAEELNSTIDAEFEEEFDDSEDDE